MVVYIDDVFLRRQKEGRIRTRNDIIEAHAEGTVLRLRPKIMTITTMGACEVLPVLYTIWRTRQLEAAQRASAPLEAGAHA